MIRETGNTAVALIHHNHEACCSVALCETVKWEVLIEDWHSPVVKSQYADFDLKKNRLFRRWIILPSVRKAPPRRRRLDYLLVSASFFFFLLFKSPWVTWSSLMLQYLSAVSACRPGTDGLLFRSVPLLSRRASRKNAGVVRRALVIRGHSLPRANRPTGLEQPRTLQRTASSHMPPRTLIISFACGSEFVLVEITIVTLLVVCSSGLTWRSVLLT